MIEWKAFSVKIELQQTGSQHRPRHYVHQAIKNDGVSILDSPPIPIWSSQDQDVSHPSFALPLHTSDKQRACIGKQLGAQLTVA